MSTLSGRLLSSTLPRKACGTAYLFSSPTPPTREAVHVSDRYVYRSEIQSFQDACATVQNNLQHLMLQHPEKEDLQELLQAQSWLLHDPVFSEQVISVIQEQQCDALTALEQAWSTWEASFAQSHSVGAQRLAEIKSLWARVAMALHQRSGREISPSAHKEQAPNTNEEQASGVILVIKQCSIEWLMWCKLDTLRGLVFEQDADVGHLRIVAEALHIPCLVGVIGCIQALRGGEWLELNETSVQIFGSSHAQCNTESAQYTNNTQHALVNAPNTQHTPENPLNAHRPNRSTRVQHIAVQDHGPSRGSPKNTDEQPARLACGKTIQLHVNLCFTRELDAVLHSCAKGIGLVRTEFLWMDAQELP
ncbi:MAG: phosphoenolpyruvate-utilizing N-terminal domain-containing protein, partial [Myxococcota bacterium]